MAKLDNIVPLPQGLLSPSALRLPPQEEPKPLPPGLDISIEANDNGISIDPKTGALSIEGDDGSVLIDFNPQLDQDKDRGETGEECAHRLGVSPKTPYKAAARLGIKFRPRDSRRAVRSAIRRSRQAELAKQKPSAPRDILRDGRWEKI